jgi:hypothetical protein
MRYSCLLDILIALLNQLIFLSTVISIKPSQVIKKERIMKLRIALLTLAISGTVLAGFHCEDEHGINIVHTFGIKQMRYGNSVVTIKGPFLHTYFAQLTMNKQHEAGFFYKFNGNEGKFEMVKTFQQSCHRGGCKIPPGSRLPDPKLPPKFPKPTTWTGKLTHKGYITYLKCTKYGTLLF